MNISKEDAAEWYDLIKKHQHSYKVTAELEGSIFSKMNHLNINDVENLDKLIYLEKHLIGSASRTLKDRISVLQGNEGDYEKYLSLELEKQQFVN